MDFMTDTQTPSRFSSGFTLVELSIVLLIIAVIAGSALQSGQSRMGFANQYQTEEKLDRIEKALAAFVAINGRLPCPADGTLAANSATLGAENCTASTFVDIAATTLDMYVGGIPFTALGLPRDFAYDGWDRKFTYAVESPFINAVNFADGTNFPNGTLTVRTGNAIGQNRVAGAIYIVASHGPNGHGAWNKTAGASRINTGSTDTDEGHNADNPAVNARLTDKTFVQSFRTSAFDDVLRFRTKWLLETEAGSIFTGNRANVCDIALRIVQPISDIAATTTSVNQPLMGPIGCQVDNSAEINSNGTRWTSYNNACMVRERLLAEAVLQRCRKKQ
jgi:prepilin-type N-terminal cleavage/methylation domain-containing protein